MFELIKKCCFIGITFSSALTSVNPLKCVWMSNQPCKIRHDIVSINRDEPTFYPYSIKTNKCSGSFNNINDPYAKICIPDVVKNISLKVFNLISRTNEARYIKMHETCM